MEILNINAVYISSLAILAYFIYTILYRLLLSPIAHIPGPKIAAITWWYEYYHDIVHYGKYIWKVQEFHQQYGPIVRISPYEVHINDPEFFEILYAASNTNRKDRWHWYTAGLGLPLCTLASDEQSLHRRRRAAMSPFFSKQNVRKLEPVIEERASTLATKLERLATHGEVMPLNLAFSAYTNDVVVQYSLGHCDHRIEAEGFDPSFHEISFAAGTSSNIMRHMNFILKVMRALPESIAMSMSLEFSSFIIILRQRLDEIREVQTQLDSKSDNHNKETIFHSLLQSDLPESEKKPERLAQEAVLLAGAGTHTTAWAMTVAAFYVLSQPDTLRKLKEELEVAMPNPLAPVALNTLEQLPYLTAVIKEGLRLSLGPTSRLPRIMVDKPLKFQGWEIPTGVPVSMTIPLVHLNENIFPDPRAFHPERWVEDKTGHLDRYLCAFSKGPRNCLGINLAWAELYLGIGMTFRRFGTPEAHGPLDVGCMELFETDVSDVEMIADGLFPLVKAGSKGVRVKLSK